MSGGSYKPSPAEAQFLGELMGIDEGLARIARDQLASGLPLSNVVATYKDAVRIVALARGQGK